MTEETMSSGFHGKDSLSLIKICTVLIANCVSIERDRGQAPRAIIRRGRAVRIRISALCRLERQFMSNLIK